MSVRLSEPRALRRRHLLALGFALLCGFCAAGTASAEHPWELLSDEAGIQVWRAEVEGSPIVALKGAGDVDAPLKLVASVIHDAARSPEWVTDLSESRLVRSPSSSEHVVYQRVKTPWPIDDREFVFLVKVSYDAAAKRMVYDMHSIDDDSIPMKTGVVRGNLKQSLFTLTSLPDASKTHLVVEVVADPMGSIPKWLVNLFQKTWPRETIESIRRQVKKADVLELESVAALMSQAPAAPAPAAAGH